MKSSSGGIFTVLAEFFLKKKGYVCGAAFDNKNHLKHIIISNKRDLQKLRGSKYIQSEIGNVLKDVKKLLDNNKWVLFSGTPCQIAGLKLFLRKDYKRLLTVGLVCHGVPSPKVFKKYINEIEKKNNCKITKINFRDKKNGWKNPSIVFSSGGHTCLSETLYNNIYGKGFLTNLFLRKECYSCIYAKIQRVSDITLGDFWGVEKFNSKLDDNKGISLILLNNHKGNNVLNTVKSKLFITRNVPLDFIINNNYPLAISSSKHVNREVFFDRFIQNSNIEELITEELDNNYFTKSRNNSVGVLNFQWENNNFGANLVSYSLNKVIEKLGYLAKTINYVPIIEQTVLDKLCSESFYKFRENFLNLTNMCKTTTDLLDLNRCFDTFVVGSDQVWRQLITKGNALHYFFDFVSYSKNIFSYGASFGHNYWDGDDFTTEKAKKLLKNFSAISVRERDGLKILREKFEINNAKQVLDPTILLNKSDYSLIVKSEKHEKILRKYIAYYFLFDDSGVIENSKKMNDISRFLNLDVINIRGNKKEVIGENKFIYNSVSSWLNYIKNCDYVFTDSYHGVLFAIIYKKNFVCIGKNSTALSRFESIFSTLSIDAKFFASLDEIKDKNILLEKINYKKINKKLKLEKKKSLEFLKKSLRNKISDIDKVKKMENEIIKEKIDRFNIEFVNQGLQTKVQELESQIQILMPRNSENESKIFETKLQEMESQNKALQISLKQLDLAIKAYQNTKTFRYANKIKKLLLKIGIKKFKL